MKKYALLSLLISTFACANIYDSSSFISLYYDKDYGSGFAKSQRYSLDSDGNYLIKYDGSQRTDEAYSKDRYHPYYYNFRIFIPAYTTDYRFFFLRDGSKGWFDVLTSLQHPANESTTDTSTIYANASTAYETTYGNNSQIEEMVNGKAVYIYDASSLEIKAEDIPNSINSTKLNKWMYVVTDPTSSGSNYRSYRDGILPGTDTGTNGGSTTTTDSTTTSNSLEYIIMSLSTTLDKAQVDAYVDSKYPSLTDSENYSFCTDSNLHSGDIGDTIKACLYVTSFGSDGSNSVLSEHSYTAAGTTIATDDTGSTPDTTTGTASVSVCSQDLANHVTMGQWNLTGVASTGCSASDLKTLGATKIWVYRNGTWKNEDDLSTLNQWEGVWIK